MDATATERLPSAPARTSSSPIVELRQYTHHPGKRDTLIEIFERTFIAEQERLGIEVIDHFRDLDDPDRFVWLRGFPDMPSRARANTEFYDGEVWQRHRDAANATLIDWENVLLLHPAGPYRYPTAGERPPAGTDSAPACLVVLTVCPLDPAVEMEFPAFFERVAAPELESAGAAILAAYATEHSPNNYPRLRIREGEHVFVWLARFADPAAYERHLAALEGSSRWRDEIAPAMSRFFTGAPEIRRLAPTARSRLRA